MSKTVKLRKGLNIPLLGEAEKVKNTVDQADVFAIKPPDFHGVMPKLDVKVGDKVFFHVTNLEQDYDVPHGIAVLGAKNSELLIMPGRTTTLLWEPKEEGVWPFYCTDFCSALHQEMQGYIRVSPKGSKVPISYTLDDDALDVE